MRRSTATWWAVGVLGVLLVSVHQKQFQSATPLSRLAVLHSVVEEGTVCIDRHYARTPDVAVHRGRFYSDKAPGTVAVALPAFALAAALLWAGGVAPDSDTGWLVTSWVACAWALALPMALGAGALWRWLRGWVSARGALVAVLAITLGAAPLPYATLLFSHTLVVGLLCVALWAVDFLALEQRDVGGSAVPGGQRRWRMGLAGFCLGLALASEYTAGLVVVAVGLYVAVWRQEGLALLLGAAVPPLLLIPAYSWACFGNPFVLPYSLNASFPAMQEGLYAIKWPDAETGFRLLFGPTRGLFFWTPFLLLAGLGYGEVFRRSPRAFWFTYLVPLAQVVVISGRVWDWPAGYSLGPRYLAPILPWLALPCAMGVQRWPKLGIVLAAYSILITTLATVTNACPDYHVYNPLTEMHVPMFLRGDFSYNLGMVCGLSPHASVALYYAMLLGGIGWLWWLAGREDRACREEPAASGVGSEGSP